MPPTEAERIQGANSFLNAFILKLHPGLPQGGAGGGRCLFRLYGAKKKCVFVEEDEDFEMISDL